MTGLNSSIFWKRCIIIDLKTVSSKDTVPVWYGCHETIRNGSNQKEKMINEI